MSDLTEFDLEPGEQLDLLAEKLFMRLGKGENGSLTVLKFLPVTNEILDILLKRVQYNASLGKYDNGFWKQGAKRVFIYNADETDLYDFDNSFSPRFTMAAIEYINSLPEFDGRDWHPLDPKDFAHEQGGWELNKIAEKIHFNVNRAYSPLKEDDLTVYSVVHLTHPETYGFAGRRHTSSDKDGLVNEETARLYREGKAVLDFALYLKKGTTGEGIPTMSLFMPGWPYDNMGVVHQDDYSEGTRTEMYHRELSYDLTSTNAILNISETGHDIEFMGDLATIFQKL